MDKFISYEGLPINSGGAHSLNRKPIEVNYEKTLNFLNLYADKTKPESIELTLYQSEKKGYSALNLALKLSLKFGIPKMKNDGWLKTWNWSLSQNNLKKGFEILKLNNELPKNILGPISLNINWNFHFKNPETNKVLPNQKLIPLLEFRNKNSKIYLRLSKKTTISVWFAFPFEKVGKYEFEFIEKLNSKLPFKPSEKHWRIWKKSEKGNWKPSKLEIKNVS